jgi:TP901 family phage tail tape measure protein
MNTGMGSAAAVLSVLVQAKGVEQTNAKLMKTQGVLSSAGGAAGRMAKQLAAMAKWGALAAAGAIGVAVKKAIDFDKEMRNVNSIAQLSEKALGRVRDKVLELAGKTAQAPATLAAGMYDLVSSGFDAHESLLILAKSARAATAGLTTTEVSTKAVAAVLNAYGLKAKMAGDVSDVLFRIVERGVIEFPELAQTIGDVLPFASSLSVNLREVGASIATMTKAGISPAETMTRIKAVMVSLLKPSEDLKKAIEAQGYESGEAMIKALGFQGTLDALSKSTHGNKEAMAALFPNVRALGGALALTGDNSKKAAGDLKGMQDAAGATARTLSQQEKSTSFLLRQLRSEVEALAIGFGEDLLPEINRVIKILTNPHLSAEEKFTRVFDTLVQAAQKGLSTAVSLAEQYGPKIVAKLASSIASAWWHLDIFGKILGAAALIRVLGGPGALTATGKAIGRFLGLGVSEGAAETIVLPEVAMGAAGARGLGAAAAGASGPRWLGTDAAPKAASQVGQFGERQALQDAGLLGGGAAATGGLGAALKSGALKLGAIAGGYFAAEFGIKVIEGITGTDLLENQDLKTSLTHGFNTQGVAATEEKALAQYKNQQGALRDAMTAIELDQLAGLGKLKSDLANGLGVISHEWKVGTGPWREATAEAMHQTVASIRAGMQNGTIEASAGQKAIHAILGKLKVVQGSDPLGLAEGVVQSFKKAGGVTQSGVNGLISDMEKMPKGAREAAQAAVLGMAAKWAQGHPKIEAQVDVLRKNLVHKFGTTNQQIVGGVTRGAEAIAGVFSSLVNTVSGYLSDLGVNVNSILKAFGVSKGVTFAVKTVKGAAGAVAGAAKGIVGAVTGKQTGGFIVPGTGSGDRPGFAGEVGAFILNREATRAYGFDRGGMVPLALEPGERYFTRREVAAMGGARTLEAMNQSVPRFQKGGELGKPQVSGPAGPLLDLGQHAANRGYNAAQEYIKRHRPKPEAGPYSGPAKGPAGTATYKGVLMAIWVKEALEYAAGKGVNAQPTSGYRSHAENVAAGRTYFSEHEKTQYPGGAVDFGGYVDPAAKAVKDAVVAATRTFKYPLLAPIGFRDDGHASGTGHMLGGLIKALSVGGPVPPAAGELVGASYYGGPTDHVSGTVGAAGVSLPGKMSFAELAMGHALGGLPFHTKLKIGYNGKSVIAEKLDIGLGGDDVNGHNRAIDLWYETANAIGMPGTGVVKVSPADGASAKGLTEGQRKLAEGKQRKANNERHLKALEQEVGQVHSPIAKQSKLWRLIKFWGRTGIFEKDEKQHILEAVQSAAAQTKPQSAVNVLSHLADYAKGHGEITGKDPSNFRDFEKAIERAQDRGREERKKTVERQKKHVESVHSRVAAKIANRAAFPELVAQLAKLRRGADVGEEYASQLVTLEPENIGDAYVDQERGAYGNELNRLLTWRNATVRAQETASREIANFEAQVAHIESLKPGTPEAAKAVGDAIKKAGGKGGGKGHKALGGLVQMFASGGKPQSAKAFGEAIKKANKGSGGGDQGGADAYKKAAYKIPLLEEAIANAKTMRDETWAGELEEIQGLTGPGGILESLPSEPVAGAFGGRIFEIQNSIRELALKVNAATEGAGPSELKELEAQLNTDWHKRFLVSEAQRNTITQFEGSYPGGRYAGMFGKGGTLGYGEWGIAGETGKPEIVQGPARVFNPTETEAIQGGGGTPALVIEELHVHKDGRVTGLYEGREFEVAVKKVVKDGRVTGRRTPGGR